MDYMYYLFLGLKNTIKLKHVMSNKSQKPILQQNTKRIISTKKKKIKLK